MEKLISVIIPAYNVEKYIAKNLDSVMGQTYKNLEIIVVNDGSTDSTREIVEEYVKKDSRILLINQENRKLAGARNTGLRIAKGEYICIFDSDDLMVPEKIEKQVAYLQQYPQCDFVYSNVYHFIDGNDEVYYFPIANIGAGGSSYKSLLEYGNYINPNAVLFKRSVYDDNGGFDERMASAEDWDYWLTISRAGTRISFMEDFLTLYRIRKDSLTRDSATMNEAALYTLGKQMSSPLLPEERTTVEKKISRYQLRLIVSYLCAGRKKDARVLMNNNPALPSFYRVALLVPSAVFSTIYTLVQKIRFSYRFKKVQDPAVLSLLQSLQ